MLVVSPFRTLSKTSIIYSPVGVNVSVGETLAYGRQPVQGMKKVQSP